jgi:hypothetical protein
MFIGSSAGRRAARRTALIVALATILPGSAATVSAQTIGWYNGDFNHVNALSNFECGTVGSWVFDDFQVPDGGWRVVGVFSKNFYQGSGLVVTEAHWEIRAGVSSSSLGTVVASGTSAASWTATGVTSGPYAEYRLSVADLDVAIGPGTYWLSVAPVVSCSANPTYLGMTEGAGAVGLPAGNNGRSYGIWRTSVTPEDLDPRFGEPTDFSLGVLIQDAADAIASLRLSKALLSGCLKTTGKVTLIAPAPAGGLTVALHSSNPHATVPPTLVFKAGVLAKSFAIVTTAVAANETVTIEASVPGQTRSAIMTLKPMAPKSVLLTPNPVVGGGAVAGTVTLECPAAPGDITVALSSTKPAAAAPADASITVPAGARTAPFAVATTPVTVLTKPSIRARANGVTKAKTLAVTPAP